MSLISRTWPALGREPGPANHGASVPGQHQPSLPLQPSEPPPPSEPHPAREAHPASESSGQSSTRQSTLTIFFGPDGYLSRPDSVRLLIKLGWNVAGILAFLAITATIASRSAGIDLSGAASELFDLHTWRGYGAITTIMGTVIYGGAIRRRKRIGARESAGERLRHALKDEGDAQPPT